ncbi:MAG: permease [Novosphingobium sp.]|nr:permease [Novosphingobium sp.]
MACIIFAYAYMTAKEQPNPLVQHGVNLAGAAFLTVSLMVNMNPPSLVLEGFWAAIAIWGLVKACRTRGRKEQV